MRWNENEFFYHISHVLIGEIPWLVTTLPAQVLSIFYGLRKLHWENCFCVFAFCSLFLGSKEWRLASLGELYYKWQPSDCQRVQANGTICNCDCQSLKGICNQETTYISSCFWNCLVMIHQDLSRCTMYILWCHDNWETRYKRSVTSKTEPYLFEQVGNHLFF